MFLYIKYSCGYFWKTGVPLYTKLVFFILHILHSVIFEMDSPPIITLVKDVKLIFNVFRGIGNWGRDTVYIRTRSVMHVSKSGRKVLDYQVTVKELPACSYLTLECQGIFQKWFGLSENMP